MFHNGENVHSFSFKKNPILGCIQESLIVLLEKKESCSCSGNGYVTAGQRSTAGDPGLAVDSPARNVYYIFIAACF
jgi:hypothetical protein